MGFASLIVAVAVGSGLVVAAPSNNTLSVYESYDLISTVASTDCLTALSANVTCYRALHTAIYQTSSWSSNALSLICTDTCTSSLNSWIDSAVTACGETTQYNISGTLQTYTVVGNETCLDISAALNVSTPAFRSLNALDTTCSYLAPDQVHCLPPVCAIEQVQVNDTCDSITANFTRSVSTATFQSWNPSINSACSNLNALVGQYLCISAVPTDAVTTSNTDCGHWYKIQDGDTCATVSSTFGISQDDFYFLNPQLGADCSALWLGNSHCVQAVGNIDTYSGYSSTSAYTTLASTIDLNATRTDNRTTTHFFYSFPPATTTTSAYNSTALNLTKDYTLCAQAMAYYNISATTEWTSEMYDDEEWYAEYKRVCLVDPQNLPTSPFNTSIVLSTSDPTGIASPTAAATGGSPTLSSATATKTATANISPNGLCGASNSGYTCAGSQFGDCCSEYGYCGSTSEFCSTANCDPEYGTCS